MKHRINITINLKDEQYNDYEEILQAFEEQLNLAYIYDITVKEYEIDEIPF